MKRILLVSTIVPYPPDRGHRIRIYHLTKQLLCAHRVGLVTMAFNGDEERQAAMLATEMPEIEPFIVVRSPAHRSFFRRAIAAVRSGFTELRGCPREVYYHAPEELKVAVRQAADQFIPHIIQVSYWFSRRAVPPLTKAEIWIDTIDLHWKRELTICRTIRDPLRRILARRRATLIREWEHKSYASVDRLIAVHAGEGQELSGLFSAPVSTIPIATTIPERPLSRAVTHEIVFLGALDYPPNRDAVRFLGCEVMPRVRIKRKEAILRVVGTGRDHRELPRKPWILYSGHVENLDDILVRSAVAAVPIRLGAGTNVKVLTLMGAGIPLVASHKAVAGLDLSDSIHILERESAEEFADALVFLLNDRAYADELGRSGHAFARANFHWENTRDDTVKLYSS